MIARLCLVLMGCALFALPAPAQQAIPKPMPRPTLADNIAVQARETPRPQPRPTGQTAANAAPDAPAAMPRTPRPQPRPDFVAQTPAPNQTRTAKPNLLQRLFGSAGQDSAAQASAPRNGSVCGDRSIRGAAIGEVTSKVKGCGISDAVRVTEVAGIALSQAAVVECGTVLALKDWIDQAMRPAFGPRDVVQLRIAAHYACRGRNNKHGARISEHGKGRALDISGFVFADGSEWSIRRDYNKQIRRAYRGACGIFGTTLGPGSDGYHEDHLHFDTARQRNGPYCR